MVVCQKSLSSRSTVGYPPSRMTVAHVNASIPSALPTLSMNATMRTKQLSSFSGFVPLPLRPALRACSICLPCSPPSLVAISAGACAQPSDTVSSQRAWLPCLLCSETPQDAIKRRQQPETIYRPSSSSWLHHNYIYNHFCNAGSNTSASKLYQQIEQRCMLPLASHCNAPWKSLYCP